jgi:hypothetical protein
VMLYKPTFMFGRWAPAAGARLAAATEPIMDRRVMVLFLPQISIHQPGVEMDIMTVV